ncbi:hypothetical protein BDY21DRAFT_212201 [Lineolata rhizophorae]|uniref:Uncharacterized protein n=1 Tax=Lineolata rhizophorae TaxID=578093 RepID=A0A6A6P488_9PEZI|nr:hypothetical protein BDY21DRAFT_212201 [Lineolata rhizophorae]
MHWPSGLSGTTIKETLMPSTRSTVARALRPLSSCRARVDIATQGPKLKRTRDRIIEPCSGRRTTRCPLTRGISTDAETARHVCGPQKATACAINGARQSGICEAGRRPSHSRRDLELATETANHAVVAELQIPKAFRGVCSAVTYLMCAYIRSRPSLEGCRQFASA